jgi:hypothetical protein
MISRPGENDGLSPFELVQELLARKLSCWDALYIAEPPVFQASWNIRTRASHTPPSPRLPPLFALR